MKILWILLFISYTAIAQPRFEVQEFTGVVKSIEPGLRFGLEYIIFDVNGKTEGFAFYPEYGTFISEKVKLGDKITVKVNVNLRMKALRKEREDIGRAISWLMLNDRISDIKINNEWFSLPDIEVKKTTRDSKVFLGQKVVGDYWHEGQRKGLLFDNGLFAYYPWPTPQRNPMNLIKTADEVSFIGNRMGPLDGCLYPINGLKDIYFFNPLIRENGTAIAYLFKQNSVCIGVKFNISRGKQLSVSFPSEEAERIKRFLNTDTEVQIYYNDYKVEGQLHPPELHALVKPGDTLYINKFGFYGGADGKHDHKEVQINGKITRINTSEKGNVISIIVASDYYVEIDAMMAQQLGYFLQKGKVVSIQGKERIKKDGEIYQKDFRIIAPEKVVVDGKTFLLYNP